MASGYSYTVVYDKAKQGSSATDDLIREVRVKDPSGNESVYIYTAKNSAGTTNKNGTADKNLINKIGQANGDADVYNKFVVEDSSTHQQDIIDSINNTTLSNDQKTTLINKVNSGTPLTAAETALFTPLIQNTNVRVDSSGNVTNAQTLDAKAAAATEEDAALKTAEQNAAGVFLKNNNDGQCFGFRLEEPFFFVDIFNCMSQILYYLLTLSTMALAIVGSAFNQVFEITVTNMKNFVDSIGIINVGWVAIRDMANILFIFMLLYLAIATILQLDEHGVKHGLSRLIVGAVLINFSLFFVKVPIDISNILAIEIYDKINPPSAKFGMGDAILTSLNFQNVYTTTAGSNNAQAFAQLHAPTTTFAMVMIMIATLIFIFIAVIIIFVKRLVTLMMLMIFSPLAFAGIAIPNHSIGHQINGKFWGTLLREAFYAPAFMFIMYLGLMILNSQGFKTSVFGSGANAGSFADGIISTGTIINYIVVIFIFIFALTVSETMGVKGAEGAIKAFDGMRSKATGWVGTNTIGRVAHTTLNKGASASFLADRAANGNFITSTLALSAQGLLKNVGKGFTEKVHHQEELQKANDAEQHGDINMRVASAIQAMNGIGGVQRSRFQAKEKEIDHYSAKDKASFLVALDQLKDKTTDEGELARIKLVSDRVRSRFHGDAEANEVKNLMRSGVPEHKNPFVRSSHGHMEAAFDRKVWETSTDEQRKYLLSNFTKDELDALEKSSPGSINEMVNFMKLKDINGVEDLIRKGNTDKRIKAAAMAGAVDSALKVAMKAAYDKLADPDLATAFLDKFKVAITDPTAVTAGDESMAELYNKNLNRYATAEPGQQKLFQQAKDVLKTAENDAKVKAETKAAQQIAQAVKAALNP